MTGRILRRSGVVGAFVAGVFGATQASADIVHTDDVIISPGSLCVGLDCVNGESFGFDTLRLKENNLRLHFDDTSTSASFPRNDWRLVANDSANGGDSHFSVEDATSGRRVFRIDAGAPTDALRVENTGDIGLGTGSPVVRLHLADGDTPTVRLEQNGSSGFTPQTWDLAGNETNFFVRDVTNGSTLPLRIRPSAPTSALDISGNGDIGVGTASPQAALHVRRTNGEAKLRIEEASTTAASRPLLELANNGRTFLEFSESGNLEWRVNIGDTSFLFNATDQTGTEMNLQQDGDLFIGGMLTQNSDKNQKHNIVEVDARSVLQRVRALSVTEWSYIGDSERDTRHIGPMAQDFHAAFGFGDNDVTISPSDLASVGLVAVKALDAELLRKDEEIHALKQRLDKMAEKLATITAQ